MWEIHIVRGALSVRLLVSGALYGSGKRTKPQPGLLLLRRVDRSRSRLHSMPMAWPGG